MYLINNPSTGQQGSTTWNAGCTATEAVADAVYVSASGQVRQARADDVAKSRVTGFIASKPTATTCTVASDGKLGGFSNLTPGDTYYLSDTPGEVTNTPGTAVAVEVGEALDSSSLLIRLDASTQL